MIDYAIARLAALKSGFIRQGPLECAIESRDQRTLLSLLSDSVFKEEADAVFSGGCANVTTILKCIHQGHQRLRLFVANLIKIAFPETFDVILGRWEMEEIKAVMRSLTSKREANEERFPFTSFILEAGKGDGWTSLKSVSEFKAALVKAQHPMAFLLNPAQCLRDRVHAELEMERNYYQEYLFKKMGAGNLAEKYFTNQLDTANIRNALLIRENLPDDDQMKDFFIQGSGRVSFSDFQRLVKEPMSEVATIINAKLQLHLPPEELSPSQCSREITRGLLNHYRMNAIIEAGSIWNFLFFMEDLDTMAADLKLATYFGAARTPYQYATHHFLGVKVA